MREMLLMSMRGARDIVRMQTVNMNNLANVNTDGFRKEIAHFDLLADGSTRAVTSPDYSSGHIRSTGRALDVAVTGEGGWIAVDPGDGTEAYSRRGDLRVDELGRLSNGAGQQVLGESGPISIPPHGKIEIGADGTISILPLGEGPNTLAVIDRIRLVKPDQALLQRGSDGVFRLPQGEVAETDASVGLQSGALEGSNVNAVEALVRMIELSRSFESQVKLMKEAKENQEQLAQVMRIS